MAGTDGNGPNVGGNVGHKRNTFANILSKNTVDYQNPGGAQALPALDPASTANYYGQLAGLYAGYQTELIGLKQQRIGARADFRDAAAGIRAEKLGTLAAVENEGIERGMAGSSAVSQNLAGVRGTAEAALQGAKRDKMETVAGTFLAEQNAATNYFMGTQQLEATKLAQQQQLMADQLERNLIISGQETQMDALKAMYKALTQQGIGGGGRGGKNTPVGGNFTWNTNPVPGDFYGRR